MHSLNGFNDSISEYFKNNFGEAFYNNYIEYSSENSRSFIRINPLETEPGELIRRLAKYEIVVHPVKKIDNALEVISGGSRIGKTLEHNLGHYYIQSLSSMLPPLVLQPKPHDKVLDLCAAPGSKTTQIAAIMDGKGTLAANEISIDRTKALVYNLERMNHPNFAVSNFKGELLSKIFENYFDKILVDVPCSGLGILQKKSDINNWWHKNHADKLAIQQLKLIIAALKMLKPGGTLVYSTCTLTIEENEQVIDKLLKKYPAEIQEIDIPLPTHSGFTGEKYSVENSSVHYSKRLLPWEIGSEGFFLAKIVKTAETEPLNPMQNNNRSVFRQVPPAHKDLRPHLEYFSEKFCVDWSVLEGYTYFMKGTDIFFNNAGWEIKPLDIFARIGQKLGSIDKHGKLAVHSQAVRVFGKHSSKNIIDLQTTDEFNTYFGGGTLKSFSENSGQKIIRYDGLYLGAAILTAEGLKSQFPRAMRSSEIMLPK